MRFLAEEGHIYEDTDEVGEAFEREAHKDG